MAYIDGYPSYERLELPAEIANLVPIKVRKMMDLPLWRIGGFAQMKINANGHGLRIFKMNNSFGLISVVVPVYNGAAYVADAIQSILAQAYEPLEIIVVDDGSTDQTAAIVQQFGPPVDYHYQHNQGSSVARNVGVAQAKGNWLAFLDADDLWAASKLAIQLAVLQQNPAVDVLWGHLVEFRGDRLEQQVQTAPIPGYHVGTMLIRTQLFAKIGAFSTAYQLGEMVDWIARLQRSSVQQMMLPDVLMYRRIHQSNKGKSGRYSKHEYLHVLKNYLDQKRASQ